VQLKTLRKILAILFVLLIFLLFIWSVRQDYRLKGVNNMFGSLIKTGIIHYTIQLKAFIPEHQTVKGTLSVEPGIVPPWIILTKESKIFYGPLSYDDLTFHYATGYFFRFKKYVPEKTFQKVHPSPMEINISAFGNPETYPFDKYFLMCAVKCPAYFKEGRTNKYLEDQEHGESLSVMNSMNGLFIRVPTKSELGQIKASFHPFTGTFRPADDKINNFTDMFALILERPYYLRFMSVVLGVMVFGAACYIGFALPLRNIPVSILGFVAAVWGIRSILLSDTKIFLSYFDYIGLFMYFLLFGGITFRTIWKGRTGH